MENDWKKRLGVVYSTDPDFEYDRNDQREENSPDPGEQKLYVSLDRKKRKGKSVTLISGFRDSQQDQKELARELKRKCGVGGSVTQDGILIQGDFRERVIPLLREKGYQVIAKGG